MPTDYRRKIIEVHTKPLEGAGKIVTTTYKDSADPHQTRDFYDAGRLVYSENTSFSGQPLPTLAPDGSIYAAPGISDVNPPAAVDDPVSTNSKKKNGSEGGPEYGAVTAQS